MRRGPYRKRDLAERFYEQVAFIPGHPCWEWTAAQTTTGYGRININRRAVKAHRVAWTLNYGPIPKGEGAHGTCVLHKCDNRLCVNPITCSSVLKPIISGT